MSANRAHSDRPPRVDLWRAVATCVLIALTVFSPIVRAVCDGEFLAHLTHSVDAGSRVATPAFAEPPSRESGVCCDDLCDAITEHARPTADDAAAAPTALPTLAAFSPSRCRAPFEWARAGPISRLYRPDVVEPVFRRVPKLLI